MRRPQHVSPCFEPLKNAGDSRHGRGPRSAPPPARYTGVARGSALLSGSPTIYTVDLTSDTGTGSGATGDLRYCITQANANTNTAGSLIEFDPTVFTPSIGGVITLSSTLELSEADGPEVIEGTVLTNPPPTPLTSAGVSVGGNDAITVFKVDSGVTASFSGLVITPETNYTGDQGGIVN